MSGDITSHLMLNKMNKLNPALSFVLGMIIFGSVAIENVLAEDLFPDKKLEAIVRKNVFEKRDSKAPLVEKDVENISTIEGKGQGIKNLKGLEKCRSLRLLDLEHNEISDLKPIAGLKLIQSLNVGKNKIKDVAPIENLVKLQLLDISNNEITNLKPLEKMSNMRTLYVSNNQLSDISVLEKLPKIWSLYLSGNQVKDFAVVGKLKWLSSLDVSKTGISDLGVLSPLTELKYLNVQGNKVEDLKPLVEMATKDSKGEQRFSPFWRVYLKGNPLGEPTNGQIEELKKLGGRLFTE